MIKMSMEMKKQYKLSIEEIGDLLYYETSRAIQDLMNLTDEEVNFNYKDLSEKDKEAIKNDFFEWMELRNLHVKETKRVIG
jgi:hypothetical protein